MLQRETKSIIGGKKLRYSHVDTKPLNKKFLTILREHKKKGIEATTLFVRRI